MKVVGGMQGEVELEHSVRQRQRTHLGCRVPELELRQPTDERTEFLVLARRQAGLAL